MPALVRWLKLRLADPRILRFALAAASVLTLHVLFEGYLVDDHALRGLTLHVPPWGQWSRSPLELFSFYTLDAARTHALIDYGFSPWWTDPHLHIELFRPLSSLLHWVDFHVDSPVLAHAVTVGFYLAVVAAVAKLYRRHLGAGWVSGFAIVVFAVDHCHGPLIEWIANRNALVAGLFAMLALLAHERAVAAAEGPLWLRAELLSALCLAIGLGGGEGALGILGYLIAHALFLDLRPVRARLASFAPHAAVLVAWAVVYKLGHYGASRSGIYIDPGADPAAFVLTAIGNVPLLLQCELGGLAPDVLLFVPQLRNLGIAVSVGLVAIPIVALAPLRRDPRVRFFLVGAVLSTGPVAATFPSIRLLLLPSIGLLAVIAIVVEGVVEHTVTWSRGPLRWAAIYTALYLGGGHLVLSPLALQITARQVWLLEAVLARFGEGLGDDPRLAGQRVVIVSSPDPFFAYVMATMRMTHGRVAPSSILSLASGKRTFEVERVSADTLIVRQESGFFRFGTELLTRRPDAAMPAGTRVSLTGVTIDVLRAGEDGVPTEAAFRFEGGLDDPALKWITWQGRTLVPFAVPAVGERRRIEAQQPTL
jgi:hypothetical protein